MACAKDPHFVVTQHKRRTTCKKLVVKKLYKYLGSFVNGLIITDYKTIKHPRQGQARDELLEQSAIMG